MLRSSKSYFPLPRARNVWFFQQFFLRSITALATFAVQATLLGNKLAATLSGNRIFKTKWKLVIPKNIISRIALVYSIHILL